MAEIMVKNGNNHNCSLSSNNGKNNPYFAHGKPETCELPMFPDLSYLQTRGDNRTQMNSQ